MGGRSREFCSATAVTIYYYDVLVRTEGFDLELSAASSDASVPAAN